LIFGSLEHNLGNILGPPVEEPTITIFFGNVIPPFFSLKMTDIL